MDLTNLGDLQAAMRLAGLRPDKSLSQHFLIDRPSLLAVADGAQVASGDTVLEIGPGLGQLTEVLIERHAKVVAIEQDANLASILQSRLGESAMIIQGDILKFDFTKLPGKYKVAANLPYHLTSAIVRLLLTLPNPPEQVALLIQKEVAERIVAGPGEMSVLAVSVQYFGQPSIAGIVERDKFWPVPRVDSAILQINMYPRPIFSAEPKRLFRLVKAGFGERRKQLKNSLAGGLNASSDQIIALLEAAHIDPMLRAQDLAMSDWQRLYEQATMLGLI